jgi:PAS domain S-box-containing protein
MHLYYIPVVLLAYHYRKKGLILSVLLALLYLALTAVYEPSNIADIEGAGIRAILFIAVAALVVYLSEHLIQTQESLRNTTQIQQSILQNANVWLMVLDSRGKILLWNKAAEEISAYNADEVIGKNEVWKLLYPEKDYRREITDKITEIIRKNNYLENLRTTIVCKNGTHKIILWNTRGLPGEADKSSQFIAIGVDITDRAHAEEELKRSEERYRQFFNTSRDCVFITSPDGRWIDLNDAAVEFFDYGSREELQKVKVSDLYEDPSERDRHLRYINERGYSIEYPVNLQKKDGTIINTLITSVAIRDEKGKIVSYQGTIRDVTERKRMEESLKKSQLQLTEAMDLADLVNWEFDVPTGIFTFNDRFYAMYGTTAEREGGYQMKAEVYAREFVHPDEIIVVADEVNKAITTTDPDYVSQVEHRIIRRDGKIRHIIVRIAITKDANGRTIKTHGANQDITEIKKTQEALRESEEQFRVIFHNQPAGLLMIDPSTHMIVDTNAATLAMTGAPREEVIGKVCHTFICPAEQGKCPITDLNQVVDNYERVLITKNGRRIPILKSVNSITIKGRRFLIESFIDITEQKRAEEIIKKFNEELEQQVKFRTKELNASLQEKVVLLREIHHRVKNNLQIIISLINLQMRQIDDKQLKQIMAETHNRVRAMSFVHEKLYQSENLSQIDLSDYARFLASQLFAFYGIDSRRIRLDIDIGNIMVDINTAIPLGLIINELVSNALKHAFPSDREGTITISSRYEDKVLTLVVSDDGIGLRPDLDWKNPESLGLRLVNSLVDQLDGTIELGKEKGTSFIISMHREIG